jgi:hypothetical protein
MSFLSLGGRNLRVSILALGALALTGCAGVATLPDTTLPGASVQPGAIQGSVFGGHAPIVGAHVYVLQAGTGNYASGSTSLITSSATSDTHGNYVLTDATGAFNVTGDYTCTVNTPVYLAATGGMTADNTGGTTYSVTPLTITGASVSSDGSTLTFTSNNLLYPNQGVVFNLGSTGNWNALNGGLYNVINTITYPLTPTSFSISTPPGVTVTGSATGTATPQSANNPAIANLAVLGNCPPSGNFSTGSTAISYVYMNEVSTTAAAYALAGFGSGPFNIGYPGGSSLAFTGIQNAANNAAQLYNIQGKYLSTVFAGEGHIANPTTPAGNGIVPQSTLDTLGNILASCVDSTNLGNGATNPDIGSGSGTPSSSCSKLFSDATSNGIPYLTAGYGTIATDTATAAFNIAHNPGANVASLFILQGTETTPFAPNLATAPADFTVAIKYPSSYTTGTTTTTVPYLVGPQAVSIDAKGDFWFTSQPTAGSNGSGYIAGSSPLGVNLYNNLNVFWMYGDVAIDSAGDAWTGNQGNYVLATEITPPVSPATAYTLATRGSSYTYAQGVTADGSGDIFIPHGPTTQNLGTGTPPADNDQTLTELNTTGGTVSTGATGNMQASFPVNAYMTHAAFDSSNDIWFTSNNGNVIARVASASGTAIAGFPLKTTTATTACPLATASTFLNPEQPSIDSGGNAWVPMYNAGAGTTVAEITPTGGCTSVSGFNGPYGTTIDGANNLWVTNRHGNSISLLSASATTPAVASSYTVGGLLNGPQGIAVDLSGDLIIANYGGNSILEVIGAATPTYAPLGVAASKTKLGAQP